MMRHLSKFYGSDGEELISKTEHGYELVRFYIHTSNPESLKEKKKISFIKSVQYIKHIYTVYPTITV